MTDFDQYIDRTGTGSIKWDKYLNKSYLNKSYLNKDYGAHDILPMWVADSDFQTCPAIIDALHTRVAHGVFGYTSQPTKALSKAIISHLKHCYNWEIEKDWIMLLPSLVSGLNLACQIAGKSGDTVLSPATIYPPFKSAPLNAGRELLTIPVCLENERWVLDLDVLEASITDESRLLLLCNPHNPGGTVYTLEELTRLHEICKQHDLLICSDEIHCDLILEKGKQHIPLATLNQDASDRTITLMAASKTFNVAGLSCGFAIVPNKKLRAQLKQSTQGLMPEVNLLGQEATTAAFTFGREWMLQQNMYLRENRDYLFREINDIKGLSMVSPEATFLAWIDVSALELEDPPRFFESAGIGMSAGKDFGDKGFMRLNFACNRSILEEAVKRIRTAVSTI